MVVNILPLVLSPRDKVLISHSGLSNPMKFRLDIDVHCGSIRPIAALLTFIRDMHWLPRFPVILTIIGAMLGLMLAVALLRILPADQYLFVPAAAFLGFLAIAFVRNSNH
jgi:hypothetical protein